MIDLGRKETISEGCCPPITNGSKDTKKKVRIYYPSISVDIESPEAGKFLDKEVEVKAKIRIVSVSAKGNYNDKGRLEIEVRGIEFPKGEDSFGSMIAEAMEEKEEKKNDA